MLETCQWRKYGKGNEKKKKGTAIPPVVSSNAPA
jgi:hypothetical protein